MDLRLRYPRFCGFVGIERNTPFFHMKAGYSLAVFGATYLYQLYQMVSDMHWFWLLPLPALLLWLIGFTSFSRVVNGLARFPRVAAVDAGLGNGAQFGLGIALGILSLPLLPLLLLAAVLWSIWL